MEYYLILGLFSLSIFVLLFLLYLFKNRKLLILNISIPVIFFIIFSFYFTFESIKSQPLQPFEAEITYLDHYEMNDKIYVWILVKKADYPVTVVVPNTKDNKKKLNESKENRKKGARVTGKMKDKNKFKDSSDDEFVDLKIVTPSTQLPPKNSV